MKPGILGPRTLAGEPLEGCCLFQDGLSFTTHNNGVQTIQSWLQCWLFSKNTLFDWGPIIILSCTCSSHESKSINYLIGCRNHFYNNCPIANSNWLRNETNSWIETAECHTIECWCYVHVRPAGIWFVFEFILFFVLFSTSICSCIVFVWWIAERCYVHVRPAGEVPWLSNRGNTGG